MTPQICFLRFHQLHTFFGFLIVGLGNCFISVSLYVTLYFLTLLISLLLTKKFLKDSFIAIKPIGNIFEIFVWLFFSHCLNLYVGDKT